MNGYGYAQGDYFGEVMRPARLSALLFSAMALMPPMAHAADALPAWNYLGGANDDEDWGLLSPNYATCTLGTAQSPVAIDAAKPSSILPMQFAYKLSNVITQRRELALIVQFSEGNHLRSEGSDYGLKQIRFHTPSEHVVKGKNMPLEIHFIHESTDHEVLIVAVQAELGQANTALQSIIEQLPEKGTPEKKTVFDPNGLLPQKRGYYAYTGSLSWPPCTENVQWRVMKETITLSHEQINAIGKLLGRNARLLQPLYLRSITETIE